MTNGDGGGAIYTTAQQKVIDMLHDITHLGYSKGKDFAVGRLENRMKNFARDNNIEIAGDSLYMGPKSLAHSQRKSKTKVGLAVQPQDIVSFIRDRRKMDLFWDGECFIYTDYVNKFIIHPNYELKINRRKSRKVSYITAGKVTNPEQFDNKMRVL